MRRWIQAALGIGSIAAAASMAPRAEACGGCFVPPRLIAMPKGQRNRRYPETEQREKAHEQGAVAAARRFHIPELLGAEDRQAAGKRQQNKDGDPVLRTVAQRVGERDHADGSPGHQAGANRAIVCFLFRVAPEHVTESLQEPTMSVGEMEHTADVIASHGPTRVRSVDVIAGCPNKT